MRSAASIAVATTAVSALLPAALAAPGANTLRYTFEKRFLGQPEEPSAPRQLLKRQTVNTAIDNLGLLYLINITVGTPPQPISLQLDTGSSDIWFPSANTRICQRSGYCLQGSYDSGASRTYRAANFPADFAIQYVDGSEIDGDYFTDVVTLGDTTITNVTMAEATQFTRDVGIMGVGFRQGESSNSGREAFTYPNIVNVLQDQGKIDSLSYSLWLDDLQSNTGSILFGGIDTDKYTGSLVALPIQRDTYSGGYTSFTVAWTGLTITGSDNNVDASPSSAQPAILDSGTTLTYVPDDIFQTISDGLGVQAYESNQLYAVPCSIAEDDLTFSFEFGGNGGAVINVPLAEFVIPLEDSRGRSIRVNGVVICQFGIYPAGNNPILFGDTFLRSAYVVYDLDNRQIGLAQTNFDANPSDGNVQAISSGAGIPDVTMTASAISVDNTFTGRPLITASFDDASGIAGGSSTRNPSFRLSPTASPSGGSSDNGGSSGGSGNGNMAGRPSADHSVLAVVMVTLGAFFFGAMLI